MHLGDRAELRVGVAVAVGVLEDDELAELLALAHLLDDAIVDRDHRSVQARVDVDAPAVRIGLDDVRGVAGGLALRRRPGQRGRVADVVGVPGICCHGEMGSLREARKRADQRIRKAAILLRPQQHLIDVPVGVVVGEHRLADVVIPTRGPQVAGRGANRINWVVRVLASVLVGVDSVGRPGGRDELHPALGPGRGDIEVGAEGRLYLVDRGQYLPGDSVLGTAGLIDREQEGRDLEGVDDGIGDPDGSGSKGRGGEARVPRRGSAIRVSQDGLGNAVALIHRHVLGGLALPLLLGEEALAATVPAALAGLAVAGPASAGAGRGSARSGAAPSGRLAAAGAAAGAAAARAAAARAAGGTSAAEVRQLGDLDVGVRERLRQRTRELRHGDRQVADADAQRAGGTGTEHGQRAAQSDDQ